MQSLKSELKTGRGVFAAKCQGEELQPQYIGTCKRAMP